MGLLDLAKELNKKHKDTILVQLLEEDDENIEFLPLDMIAFEFVIGKKGIPLHRITQIAGFEDSGKSLMAYFIMKKFQEYFKDNGYVILADTEVSFNKTFFEKLGGDSSNLLVVEPTTVEETFKIFEDAVKYARSKGDDSHILYVIDSLSVAVEDEVEKDSTQVGLHSRILSKCFRKIKPSLPKWNATLIYISQNKEKIGTFYGGVARLGGHAVEFAPVLTLELKRLKEEKDALGNIIGIHFKLKATKNHLSIPFREIELYFDLKKYTFIDEYSLFLLACMCEIVKPVAKGWYEFNGKKYRPKDLMNLWKTENEVKEKLVNDIRQYFSIEV